MSLSSSSNFTQGNAFPWQTRANIALLSLTAFSFQTLFDTRWLLGGFKTQPGINANWHSILTVDERKQQILLWRVFHWHDVAIRRGGKATIPRLAPDQWHAEIDKACLCGHIWSLMSKVPEQFPDEVEAKVLLAMTEGCHG